MNSKSLRRLAIDHGSLHKGLPPNYLFPPSNALDSSDLTSLDILLAGPIGTPYAKGLWRLHLDIPPTYPNAPPTATFRTRLWHPNIDEATGSVCVETLKRDWSSTLKLRDVLITISCLLIQPNPTSALNEAAGKLASEDWDSYCRRAKLMTEIHASIPRHMAEEVREAQMRGEDEKSEEAAVKSDLNDRDKGIIKANSDAVSIHQKLMAEDAENRGHKSDTAEPHSDPESDWIPGPAKSPKPFQPSGDNILGIKGLEHNVQFNNPPQRTPGNSRTAKQCAKASDNAKPFMTVSSKYDPLHSFSLRVPPTKPEDNVTAAGPDSPRFLHQNIFSLIQSNEQTHPFIKEFSWSWQDSEILHNLDVIKDGPTKADVHKRMASADFKQLKIWELKKFKKTGYDISKYNRGDFGPKTGIARL